MKPPRFLLVLALSLSTAVSAFATAYTGNGATGFGGTIGGSTLNVTNTNAGLITFSLTTPTAFSGNDLVIYIDSVTGGLASTQTLTDTADGGRTAISGFSGSGRTLASFPAGFTADYAISLEPGNFAGLYRLDNTANLTFITSANLVSNNTSFTFTLDRSNLGLTLATAQTFSFAGTLISTSGYRSNETIGASTTTPGSAGDTPNAGFTGTTTFSGANSYIVSIPEPSIACYITLGVLGLAGMQLRRFRRA